MTTTSPAPLIEDLFCQGHPLDHVIAVGADVGWTRDDVMAVLRDREWDLNPSGRIPRSKRITLPRGLRGLPPAPATPAPKPRPTPPPPARFEEPLDVVADQLDDVDELGDQVPADDPGATPAPRAKRPGRQPQPIEHGSERGYVQHKRKKVPIPEGDSCGCQAAHDATLTRTRRHAGTSVPDPLTGAPLPTEPPTPEQDAAEQVALDVPVDAPPQVSGDWIARATEIREQVDAIHSRANPDGTLNADHVAAEQTLRCREGLPGYFHELDGPGNFLPGPQTPTEGTAPGTIGADAAGTAPDDVVDAATNESGHGNAGPDAQPQVSPSHSHLPEDDGGPGASDAPAEPSVTADRAIAATAGCLPVDVDEWLAASQRSTRPVVRKKAAAALVALLRLRCALDELDRAERTPNRGTR